MARKQIKGYYFSIKSESTGKNCHPYFLNSNDLSSIISSIRNTQLLERFRDDYILVLRGDSLRGDGITIPVFDGYTSALFMRRRNLDLPRTAHEEGDGITVNQIDIGDDSFVMETTYVLIHDETATILFLINGNVCNGNNPLVRYLQRFQCGDNKNIFEVSPIINSDSLSRLKHLERVTKIELSYRGILDPAYDESNNKSMAHIFKTMAKMSNDSNAGTISVKMSSKRGKSLSKIDAKELYDDLIENKEMRKDTKLFKVRGFGDNGIETIDFINNDFLFTMTTDVSTRNLDPDVVLAEMHNHFEQNIGFIKESIGLLN